MVDFDQSAGTNSPGGTGDAMPVETTGGEYFNAEQPFRPHADSDGLAAATSEFADRSLPQGAGEEMEPGEPAMDEDEAVLAEALRSELASQVEQAVQHRLLTHNLMQAQQNHGDEFEAAYRMLLQNASPGLVQDILARDDPGESIVQWYQRARLLAEVPDGDVDAWVLRRYAELTAGSPAAGQQLPPPSLVGARGSGRPLSEAVPDSAFSYAFGA